jgi:hypothetical protein
MAIVGIGSVLLGVADAQSVHPRNNQEKDACNAAINLNMISKRLEAPTVSQMNEFLVIKHSLLFDRRSDSLGSKSGMGTKQFEPADLKPDLDELLSFIWSLETDVIPKLYPSALHTVSAPHLTVRILQNSGLAAGACALAEPNTVIQVSDTLVKQLREVAVQEAIAETPGPKMFLTKEKLLDEIIEFEPAQLTTDDVLNRTEAYERAANRKILDAWGISQLANRIYVRALLFVLGHEAAHIWFDQCKTPDEARADDYGLLVSTTWAAEQFQYAALKAQREKRRNQLITEKKQERKLARMKLRRGLTGGQDDTPSELLATAKLTDLEIERSIDEDLGNDDLTDLARPLGRLGFETITLVYVKAGITGDDATHPTFAVRKQRLEEGYRTESLEGEKIMHAIFGGKKQFDLFVAKSQTGAGDEMIGSLFELSEIDNATHSECEIQR